MKYESLIFYTYTWCMYEYKKVSERDFPGSLVQMQVRSLLGELRPYGCTEQPERNIVEKKRQCANESHR